MNREMQTQHRPITLAEVSEAIANGRVPAQIEDGYYRISRRSLLRLRTQDETRARAQVNRDQRVEMAC